MKRRKSKKIDRNLITYQIDQEPIVLSKPLLDQLLNQPNPANLIALYCFYYYTAKWQRTNQPKATINYVAKGIKWGVDKVRAAKKQLKNLGLIDDVIERDKGKVSGHYIKVNFIWSNTSSHFIDFTRGGKTPGMVKSKVNALSTNNINKKKNTKKSELEIFNKHIPKEWKNDNFLQKSLKDYITHRNQKGNKLTPIACQRAAKKLLKYDIKISIKALVASVENGWTGVFPESIKQPSSDKPQKTTPPKEIFNEAFGEAKTKRFFPYFEEAQALLTDQSNGYAQELAQNIITLYTWVDENQTEEAKSNMRIPGPDQMIWEYTSWLEKQTWLGEVEPGVYLPTNNLFKRKYLAHQNNEVGLNVLTGKLQI